MIQIRRSIFETNSSSTHSITVENRTLQHSSLLQDKEGYIHTYLGDYGWDFEDYTDQNHKLSYLITMIAGIHSIDAWYNDGKELKAAIEKIQDTEDFKRIQDVVVSYTGAKGIILDKSSGYIDHQSIRCSTLDDFLEESETSILEFIFADTTVHTGNDNDY